MIPHPQGQWSDAACTYRIASTVDPGDQVAESAEANNADSLLYCAGTACY